MKRVFILLFLMVAIEAHAQIAKPEYIKMGASPKDFVEWAKSIKKWSPVDAPDFTIKSDSITLNYRISDYKVVNNDYTGTDYIYLFKGGQVSRTLVMPHNLNEFHERMLVDHEFVGMCDIDTNTWESVYGYGSKQVDSVKTHTYENKDFAYKAVVVVTYTDKGYEIAEGYEMYCEPIE